MKARIAGVGGTAKTPLALILVRNTVTHDARIHREAQTLRALGYDVLIVGVVSTTERERMLEIEGTLVTRLDPLSLLKRLAGRGVPRPSGGNVAGAPGAGARAAGRAGPAAVNHAGLRRRVRRVAVTAAYYVQGSLLAWRASPVIVHANDYNTVWIGIAAKVLRRSRLIYDTHELWPDRNGRPEWRFWLLACEALFVRAADGVLTSSPGYAKAIAKRYRVAEPTVIRNIPAGGPRPTSATAGAAAARDQPVIVYVGGLMPGRGLEQAIRAMSRAPELRLRLVGPGNDSYRASLQRYAEQAGVAGRVELREPVAPSELLAAIADADAGLMLIEPVSASYELTLPNKLFEYAAAGLPILASDLPVLGGVVREQGLGEIVAIDDVQSVADGMRRLVEPGVNAAIRERVRSFAARETWEREQHRLARSYTELMDGR